MSFFDRLEAVKDTYYNPPKTDNPRVGETKISGMTPAEMKRQAKELANSPQTDAYLRQLEADAQYRPAQIEAGWEKFGEECSAIESKVRANKTTKSGNNETVKDAGKGLWNWIKNNRWKSAGIGAAIVAACVGLYAYLFNNKNDDTVKDLN